MNDLSRQKNAVKWLRILYPSWAIVGMFSLMYVPSTLIDKSDAILTADQISSNEFLFRLGISGSLFTQLISIAVVYFLYRLFFHEFKEAIILTALFNFLGMPLAMSGVGRQLAALDVLEQPEMVLTLLQQGTHDTAIATIFWGLWLVPIGYMVIRSPLFPNFLGWLLILAGSGYTINAFLYFLGFKGAAIMGYLEVLTFGELIWMLWVMIMGARWKSLETH